MPVVADDGRVWLALVRGDRRLHELKLGKVLKQGTRAATPEEIEAAFGAQPGSIGPVGIREGAIGGIVADETLREGAWVTGANRTGWHLTGVEAGRDYQATFADLHEVETGDACPHCGGVLTHRADDRDRQHLQARHHATPRPWARATWTSSAPSSRS